MEKIETVLFVVAIAAALYGYIHYGRQIPARKLAPRPFTWLIWGLLGTCVSVIQIKNGADLGAVGALTGAISGYVLAAMSWYYGKRRIYGTDIFSLSAVSMLFLAWSFVGDAATAVIASAVYLVGFIPTIARTWRAPHKEGKLPFFISSLKYVISLILLGNISVETAFYPAVLAVANAIFLMMLFVRLRQKPTVVIKKRK